MKKKKNTLGRILRIIFILLASGAIAYYLLSGPRGAIKLIRIKNERDRLKNEIKDLELQKSVLDSEKTRLESDPEYIEKIAREEYNMKKKGEKVYKIVGDDNK